MQLKPIMLDCDLICLICAQVWVKMQKAGDWNDLSEKIKTAS